jgi:hypothetical protein
MSTKEILVILTACACFAPAVVEAGQGTNTTVLRGIAIVDNAPETYGLVESWGGREISEVIPTKQINRIFVTSPHSLTAKESGVVAEENVRLAWEILRSSASFMTKDKAKDILFSSAWQALVTMADGSWYILEVDDRSIQRDVVVKVRSGLERGVLQFPNPKRKGGS